MKLLSPLKVGSLEVRNRIVSTAHGAFLEFYKPGDSGDRYIAYQERRARGGAGLIILTAMHVHHSGQNTGHFVYDKDDMPEKFRRLSDTLHRHGTKTIVQLFHFGAQGKSDGRDDLTPLWSFSGTPSTDGEASHEMTNDEIEEIIQAFVDTAVIAVENGMDGVELHGTHGYLIQQSFSPYANKRTDIWGERLHFASTLGRRVREAIGPEAVLGLRISSDDFIRPEAGGLGHQGLCDIAADLVSLGHFDYLNHSEGAGGAHYARAIGSYRHPFGEYLPLTAGLRSAINAAIPVIGVGKIPTPDLAEQALQDSDCDLVGLTRAQIADPDFGQKLMAGTPHLIRTCTGSNQGCIDRQPGPFPLTCFQNPEVGQEYKLLPLTQVSEPKKVLIIGAGPAGLKAAELAAQRGHDVTVAEASDRIGGRLNHVAEMGDAANLLSAINWLEQALDNLKVKILTQTIVDMAFIKDFSPDSIILATGAIASRELTATSDGSIPVISSDDAVTGTLEGNQFDIKDTRALVVDLKGTTETGLVTESLAKRGSQVTLITPFPQYGPSIGFTHSADLLGSLQKLSCAIETTTQLIAIAEGKAETRHPFTGMQSRSFDFIVAGGHAHPQSHLYHEIAKQYPVTQVGDAVAPRTAMEAFREGDRAGRTL